jgi:NAD(P)-dependent dehydrogenase (short-subunit alcohol dehydrogenase family)
MKIAVITGGAGGIGKCLTDTFINAGYIVCVIDVDKLGGEALVAKYGKDKLFFFCGDIAEKNVLEKFAKSVEEKYGRVDVLINNACLMKGGVHTCSYEDFNYVFNVGVTAPFYLTKLFKDIFTTGASIVNISSSRAFMSQADTESYTAAKGGVTALTHGLSVSLAGKVRVNSIAPGWIDTTESEFSEEDNTQHPAGRIGKVQDIAEMALFLCSDKAGFITGENITIDGGMTKLMIYHNDLGWTYSK